MDDGQGEVPMEMKPRHAHTRPQPPSTSMRAGSSEATVRRLEEKLSRRDSKIELLKNQLAQVKKREVLLVQEVQRTRQLAADSAAQNSKQFLKMRNHLAATHERERMLRDQIESIRSTTSACTSSVLPSPDRQSLGFSPGSICTSARGQRVDADFVAASAAEVESLQEKLRVADEKLRAVEARLSEEVQQRAEAEARMQEAQTRQGALEQQLKEREQVPAPAPAADAPADKVALLARLRDGGLVDPALSFVDEVVGNSDVEYVRVVLTLAERLNESSNVSLTGGWPHPSHNARDNDEDEDEGVKGEVEGGVKAATAVEAAPPTHEEPVVADAPAAQEAKVHAAPHGDTAADAETDNDAHTSQPPTADNTAASVTSAEPAAVLPSSPEAPHAPAPAEAAGEAPAQAEAPAAAAVVTEAEEAEPTAEDSKETATEDDAAPAAGGSPPRTFDLSSREQEAYSANLSYGYEGTETRAEDDTSTSAPVAEGDEAPAAEAEAKPAPAEPTEVQELHEQAEQQEQEQEQAGAYEHAGGFEVQHEHAAGYEEGQVAAHAHAKGVYAEAADGVAAVGAVAGGAGADGAEQEYYADYRPYVSGDWVRHWDLTHYCPYYESLTTAEVLWEAPEGFDETTAVLYEVQYTEEETAAWQAQQQAEGAATHEGYAEGEHVEAEGGAPDFDSNAVAAAQTAEGEGAHTHPDTAHKPQADAEGEGEADTVQEHPPHDGGAPEFDSFAVAADGGKQAPVSTAEAEDAQESGGVPDFDSYAAAAAKEDTHEPEATPALQVEEGDAHTAPTPAPQDIEPPLPPQTPEPDAKTADEGDEQNVPSPAAAIANGGDDHAHEHAANGHMNGAAAEAGAPAANGTHDAAADLEEQLRVIQGKIGALLPEGCSYEEFFAAKNEEEVLPARAKSTERVERMVQTFSKGKESQPEGKEMTLFSMDFD